MKRIPAATAYSSYFWTHECAVLDIMKVASAEPIELDNLEGYAVIRLCRASGRSAEHEHDEIKQLAGGLDFLRCAGSNRLNESQMPAFGSGCFQLPLKSRSYFQVAQTMRASLLAIATTALL